MNAELLFLGTSASLGIPVIGCECEVCKTTKRLRPSVLLEVSGKTILIDAGPDFREQALKINLKHLDGLILTHAHYDHVSGFDDLRPFYFKYKKPVPVLLSKETLGELMRRFPYIEEDIKFDFTVLPDDEGEIVFSEIKIDYFSFYQRETKVTGYRIGNLAYVTDIRTYSPKIFDWLNGARYLVLSALRHEPTKSHFSISEGIEFAKKTKAKQVYFTHIAHELGMKADLPDNFKLASDGEKIIFSYD